MKRVPIALIVALTLASWLIGTAATASTNMVKLVILPFQVNADRDLTFLRNGIVDMLSSRLSRPGTVTIIDRRAVASALETTPGEIDEEKAREIGARLGVDHVLFGSITAIGGAISVDTRILDIKGTEPARHFFIQADTLGEVIPGISRLSGDINQQVFGLKQRADTTQPVPSPPVTSPRSHPEKLLTQQRPPAPAPVQPSSPFITSGEKSGEGQGPFIQSGQPRAGQFWRSRTFPLRMNGLAMGDVDGDGRNEIVIITDHRAHIYRYEGGQLVKLSETKKKRNHYFVGVDIADINANGRPEIFITALGPYKNKLYSSVLEFDGLAYLTLIEDSPWYYRVSTSPGMRPVLLGQKPPDEDPYKAPVYELQWNGTDYAPTHRRVPAKKTNALGCVVGDLRNDGNLTVAAFNENDTILIIDDKGEEISSSSDKFGGNLLSINLPVADRGEPPPIRYLPMRLIIHDTDGDGRNELIVVKNKELVGKHLVRFRKFSKSKAVGLLWNGAGMGEIWQTQEVSGRVADIAIADLEGDGRQDMVMILVAKEGRLIGTKPKTSIIAYPLK